MQSLMVGLVERSAGWERLLSQEGVWWKPCDLSRPVSAEQFAVIIVNRALNEAEKKNYADFLNNRGRALRDFDLGRKVLHESAADRGFIALDKCLPERASLADKGLLRREFSAKLRKLFMERGLPFAQLWFFPGKARNVFSFHLDVDNADLEAVEKVLWNVKRAGLKATWFLNGIECSKEPGIAKLLLRERQDIGLHGWEHEVHGSFDENCRSLEKSLAFLREQGVKGAAGFSSPNGHWNSALGKALAEKGLEFTVSFSLSFLDLPFDVDGKGKAGVLALGIHPVCVGLLKTRDFDEEKMVKFFRETMNKCIAAEIPCLFYGHPSKRMERYPELLKSMAAHSAEQGIPAVSLGEYAGWWKRRSRKKFEAFADKGKLVIKTDNRSKEFYLRAFNPEGEERLLELKQGRTALKGRQWQETEAKKAEFTSDKISRPGIKHLAKGTVARALGK